MINQSNLRKPPKQTNLHPKIGSRSHLKSSSLGPLLDRNCCVIVVLVKMCLGVLYKIAFIGSVAEYLSVIIRGEVFFQCRPYVVMILVLWIPSWIWGGGINWYCHQRFLPVVTHTFNLDQISDLQGRRLVRCFIKPKLTLYVRNFLRQSDLTALVILLVLPKKWLWYKIIPVSPWKTSLEMYLNLRVSIKFGRL